MVNTGVPSRIQTSEASVNGRKVAVTYDADAVMNVVQPDPQAPESGVEITLHAAACDPAALEARAKQKRQ